VSARAELPSEHAPPLAADVEAVARAPVAAREPGRLQGAGEAHETPARPVPEDRRRGVADRVGHLDAPPATAGLEQRRAIVDLSAPASQSLNLLPVTS
jgi:hypothetical protein